MAKAKLLYDEKVRFLDGRLEARIVAYEVPKSKKFPDGIKLRCILLGFQIQAPRLLLDNHDPYGYHLHTKMPHNKSHRVQVDVENYEEAISFFMQEVQRMVNYEA